MNEQASPGWYPDGQGNERFWDGTAWTDQIRPLGVSPIEQKKPGAFSKLGAAVKNAASEKKAAKEERARKLAEDALAAGLLVTSGVFGTSTIELYENGYVRIASWPAGVSANGPKTIDKDAPYEKLRSIKFAQPDGSGSESSSALEGAVGPAVAKLIKGGKGLVRASAPGMAAAGIAHLASNAARKSFLTIATDRQIHTLTNQVTNSVGLKTSNKGHDDVARAIEAAANDVLGVVTAGPASVEEAPTSSPAQVRQEPSQPAASPTLSDRLRELADLHREGILSDEEFTSAKAKLLGGL